MKIKCNILTKKTWLLILYISVPYFVKIRPHLSITLSNLINHANVLSMPIACSQST